jgi:hypothetical protein
MSMDVDFSEPYLESIELEPVPVPTPQFMKVSIGGVAFPVVNTSFEPYRRDAFRHRSIQSQRQSIDFTNVPGEGTVNTEGLWRRGAVDWHFGAGQPFQDRKGSEDARFSTSKGINPWMQWQASLLSDTEQIVPSTGQTQVLQVGNYLYVLDLAAQTLQFSSNLTTWSYVIFTSPPHTPVLSYMATNGNDLWIADQANASGTARATCATRLTT